MDEDVWDGEGGHSDANPEEDESEEMELLWSGPNLSGRAKKHETHGHHGNPAMKSCRCVLSIDADCFYAQCEMLRNPELDGKPVGVQQKSIVITCNYLGRRSGIAKGDSLKVVREKCPDIHIINGEDLSFYRVVSQRMFEVASEELAAFERGIGGASANQRVAATDAKVEKMGMDEIFMDVSAAVDAVCQQQQHVEGSANVPSGFHGIVYGSGGEGDDSARLKVASQVCRRIRRAVYERVGLTTSGGVSTSKLLSKMVASMNKPNLQTIFVPTAPNIDLLLPSDLLVRRVPGIGRAASARLAEVSVTTVGELRELDSWPFAAGSTADPRGDTAATHSAPTKLPPLEVLKALAFGRCDAPVVRSRPPKSVAAEDSYHGRLLSTLDMVHGELNLLALKLLVKIRQDEVFFGEREPANVVLTVTTPSDVLRHGHRVSKSTKLPFKVGQPPRDTPPVSADELTDGDRALAARLAKTGLDLSRGLLEGEAAVQVRTLTLGVRFGEVNTQLGRPLCGANPFTASVHSYVAGPAPAPALARTSIEPRVSSYWNASRLSFIGSWKTRWRIFMRKLRETPRVDPQFARDLAAVPRTHYGTYFLHIDFDAFFVSAALLETPELQSIPAAVVSGSGATSEVCSANYVARARGLRSNMFVRSALEKCPDVRLIPVTPELFSVMTTKAEDLMALLLQVTTQIKSLSCDESFVRIRDDPAGSWDPDDLATLIRNAITRVTGGLTVSVGIGHSTIAARFATTKAKPPGVGVFRLTQDEVTHALRDASPSVVSGIGKSTVEKLSVLGVKTCADLLAVPIAVLQTRFGASQGMNFHTMAKGNDFITTDEKSFDVWADVDQVPATLQNEMNYSVRMQTVDELNALIGAVVTKLVERLRDEDLMAATATIKLSLRKPGAPEPTKSGGCGSCDVWSRSTQFVQPATTLDHVLRACCTLARQSPRPISEVRGVGVSLSRLSRAGVPRVVGKAISGGATAEASIPTLFEKRRSSISTKRSAVIPVASGDAVASQFAGEVSPADVDEAVLDELPADIQAELRAQMQHSQRQPRKPKVRKIDHFFRPDSSS